MKRFRFFRRAVIRLTGVQAIISFAVLGVSVLSATMLFFAFQNRFTEAIEQAVLTSNIQMGRQVGDSMESYFGDMLSIAELISDGMRGNPDGMQETIRLAGELREDVVVVAVLDWSGRPLITPTGQTLREDVNIYRQEWVDVQKLYREGYVFSMPHLQTLFRGQYEWVVSLLYLTGWTDEDGIQQYGCVLVDINFLSFDDICSKVSYDNSGFVYITDRHGDIVYHPAQQLLYLGLKDEQATSFVGVPDGGMIGSYNGRRCAYSVYTLAYSGWRVVRVDYLKSAMNFDNSIQRDLFTIFGAIVLIVFGVAFAVSYIVARPIRKLTGIVQEIHSREFDSVDASSFRIPREVRELALAFDRMLERISALLVRIEEEQVQLRKIEIKTLQAQIKPHFLYNTLDSIVWMAEAGDHKGVTVMTTALADFFRLSISDGRDYITVEEEMRYAQSYLTIQSVRYQDKFDYEIIAEEGVRDLSVTKFILQPLIENAIYHGIEKSPDPGKITVRACIRGERLLLEITDNGCGMDAQTLMSILQKNPDGKSAIGVKNVHQRIQMLFGAEYGLEFESELEEGTTVRVWLPILRQGGKE